MVLVVGFVECVRFIQCPPDIPVYRPGQGIGLPIDFVRMPRAKGIAATRQRKIFPLLICTCQSNPSDCVLPGAYSL